MRRYSFYILIALLTFVTGSFIALKIYRKSQVSLYKAPESLISDNFSKQSEIKTPLQNPFASLPAQETLEDESGRPFCRDKKILPIWNQLVKTKDFQEWISTPYESKNCRDLLDIKEFDLNNDGQNEILIRGKNSPNLCGGVGNCAFWIYAKQGKKYVNLLSSTDYQDITELPNQVKRTKTKGYFDIVLKGHLTASDTSYSTYKFNGKKYMQKNCLMRTYIRGTTPDTKWEFISCTEFYKRWEREK